MKKMNVQFDFETWSCYVLPYCNLDDCKLLIKQFQSIGFTVKELLSPLLTVVITSQNLKLALDLCKYRRLIYSSRKFIFQGVHILHRTKFRYLIS